MVNPFTGVTTDATLTGDGKTTPLSVVSVPTTIVTDGVTLQGDGSVGTPAAILKVQTNTSDITGDGIVGNVLELANYGTATYLYSPRIDLDAKGRATISNYSSETDVFDSFNFNTVNGVNTITTFTTNIAGFTNIFPTANIFVVATGVFTCSLAGWYSIHFICDYAANAAGYRQTQIVQNPLASLANMVIAENVNSNVSAGFRTVSCCTANTYLNVNDTIFTRYFQNSGGALGARGYIAITYVHS